MKATVASVLFGSVLGCLSCTDSAWASPQFFRPTKSDAPITPMLSAKRLSSEKLLIVPQIINLVDRIFTVNQSEKLNLSIDQEAELIFTEPFGLQLQNSEITFNQHLYTHRQTESNLIVGFQKTFWAGQSPGKYWGFTTVEHWGNSSLSQQQLNLRQLNYAKVAPALPVGSSRLTVSGGGDHNLAQEANSSQEFEQFRGGMAYHHGVVEDVTMGVGFVYEDLWMGFTQLTYDSSILPLKTTVSLLGEESGIELRSHVRLEPVSNLVLNYYHDRDEDKINANWQLISGLTLIAESDRQQNTLSTGMEVAVKNEYMSFSAKAALDRGNNLQWKVKSRIGNLQFIHESNRQNSKSEIDLDLVESQAMGFKVSAYVDYQTKMVKEEQQEFAVWGSKIESTNKIAPNQHQWSLNLGYGSGTYGKGLIASGILGLKPNLSLKLTYQEVSQNSDETKIKLQLGSP